MEKLVVRTIAVLLAVACIALFGVCLFSFLMCDSRPRGLAYAVSRDGRLVAYTIRDRSVLVVASLGSGEPQQVVEAFDIIFSVEWHHANKTLFVIAKRRGERYPSLYSVQGNKARLLYEGRPPAGINALSASPDGSTLAFLEATRRQGDLFGGSYPTDWILKEYSIETGKTTVRTTEGEFSVRRPAFSADGAVVAISGSSRILLLNRRDGRSREIPVLDSSPGDPVFDDAGTALYYISLPHMLATARLVRIDLESGDPRIVGTMPTGSTYLTALYDPWRLFCVVQPASQDAPVLLEINPETAETKELLRLEER